MCTPVTPQSDRRHAMPEAPAARHDAIRTAIHSLGEEQRRLERIGFELPLARCHAETRYWNFLAAVCAIPVVADRGEGFVCPDDRAA
ncbi:MAG: hypothetical protein HY076_05595 [Candidatus Eisenbacteria bacterium]|uniref:Uncharacterized protein n=1 Tax=Eiseniibacteriota bacterium TaxID=2212470 RepID=A0A9D6L6C3_UNCEI|nr:hypothetical protein [Candidatus Eisenbacteria bacterium]MBI3539728.1 hypothetical protein [Candidatus Eisenbacteria bacterium]